MTRFIVIRINRNYRDTYAAPDFDAALEAAQPADGDVVELGIVRAVDAAAARLAQPLCWVQVARAHQGR